MNRYERQGLGVVVTTQVAWFLTNLEAEQYANDRNSIVMFEDANKWYEAHPASYAQVSWQPPTLADKEKTISYLKDQRDIIRRQRDDYLNRRGYAVVVGYIALMFALTIAIVVPILVLVKNYFPAFILGLIEVALALATLYLSKWSGKLSLNAEQLLFLRAHRVLENLNDYRSSKAPVPHFKKKARDELEIFIRQADTRWQIGSFKLAANILAPLKMLKDGLRQRILPGIQDDDKIERCQDATIGLCEYLLIPQPRLQDVNRLNSLIWLLPETIQKQTRMVRLWRWIKLKVKISTVVPAGLSMASGGIFYVLATFSGIASKDALQPAVALSVGLSAIYASLWVYLDRRQRKIPD